MIAEVRALGVYKDGNLIRSTFPAAPGARVFSAEDELLKSFLGFDENGVNMGKVAGHEVDAKFNLNRLLQKHFAILALSGAGKSYLSSVIIEEILDRKKECGRIAVIIIDVHGEYHGFKESNEYKEKTSIFEGKKVKIALRKISPQMLFDFIPELSIPQRRDITKVMLELKKEAQQKGELYDLNDLIAKIEASNMKEATKNSLNALLYSLKSLKIFGKGDNPTINELAQPGKLAIIDLSEIDNLKKKQLILAYFARKLFRMRKKDRIPPFLLLIEESHNFAREKASRHEMVSKGIIETIAREGRKFGASLGLVSQRPVQLSTTALSQANTHIIMKVTNPYDLKHIGESCEGIDNSMLTSITTLRVGEALVVGEASNFPVFVKVRKRKSKKSSKGESIEVIAKRFEEMNKKKKEDVEAFI
jgi:hypothetical protein